MSRLINLTLLPLVILSFVAMVFGSDFVAISTDKTTITGYSAVNESATKSWYTSGKGYLNIDPLTGAIAIIMALAITVSIIGIKILGSGLSDESVRTLIIAITYTGIWTVLSILAYALLVSIEIFGLLIYVALTIGYVVGVIEKISGGVS